MRNLARFLGVSSPASQAPSQAQMDQIDEATRKLDQETEGLVRDLNRVARFRDPIGEIVRNLKRVQGG